MVDRIKDAAKMFKARITRDQTEELLLQATNEQNWQTPTPILHQIANAANEYDQWKKIFDFIFEKLKQKRWKKILKSLQVVDFLLKNGPSNVIPAFKNQMYTFKTFETFSCFEQSIDRGAAIREKAKSILELITNPEILEQERLKAFNIKQRLGISENYQNKSIPPSTNNYEIKSKYEGLGSDFSNKINSYQNPTEKVFNKNAKFSNNEIPNDKQILLDEPGDIPKYNNQETIFNNNSSFVKDYKPPVKKAETGISKKNLKEVPQKQSNNTGEKKHFTLPKNFHIKSNNPSQNSNFIVSEESNTNYNLLQTSKPVSNNVIANNMPNSKKQDLNIFDFDLKSTITNQQSEKYVPPPKNLNIDFLTKSGPILESNKINPPKAVQNPKTINMKEMPLNTTKQNPKNDITWLSKEEQNLIDFSDITDIKKPKQDISNQNDYVYLNLNNNFTTTNNPLPNSINNNMNINNYPSQQPNMNAIQIQQMQQFQQFQQFLLMQQYHARMQ